ncbi:hypothetical protein GCM10007173_36290 [Glutamicibacter ardleyensis]|uniref:Uncharacterized protein n=1 Tax=Glutamicibacter ardleyensis TaxID=225894 RepID=A0ABQ2DV50_9MICC|nr:hypothetical protein GCM10007173_36290 [Glutamicibacter ardleyensis]
MGNENVIPNEINNERQHVFPAWGIGDHVGCNAVNRGIPCIEGVHTFWWTDQIVTLLHNLAISNPDKPH